jgi:type II secretory pathway pseudopilin PulG
MNTTHHLKHPKNGLTLLEMTLVILVLLTLIGVSMTSFGRIGDYQKGRAASEVLRAVYTAQKMYLADNPTAPLASLTDALIIPYLPNAPGAMPTAVSLTGAQLTINVNASPPVLTGGVAGNYDPSGSTTDSLWDVGK